MRLFIRITLGILIFIVLLIITTKASPVYKLDGFAGIVIPLMLFTDDSKYSEGYSPAKFLEIKTGMTTRQVYEILGKPIRRDEWKSERLFLWYSMSPNSTHYRARQIIITNGKVTQINAYFYLD